MIATQLIAVCTTDDRSSQFDPHIVLSVLTAPAKSACLIVDLIEHRVPQPFLDGRFPPATASLGDLDLLWERPRLDLAVERRT